VKDDSYVLSNSPGGGTGGEICQKAIQNIDSGVVLGSYESLKGHWKYVTFHSNYVPILQLF